MIRVSEFVGRGHPDKMADRLADRLAIIIKDFHKKIDGVALEVLLTNDHVTVAGEIGGLFDLDDFHKNRLNGKIRREVRLFLIKEGYDPATFGRIKLVLNNQSTEIREYSKLSDIFQIKPGDQSVCYGYACRSKLGLETYMPEDFDIARRIIAKLRDIRGIYEDAKCLVAIDDDCSGGSSIKLKELVVSAHHHFDMSVDKARDLITKFAIEPVLREFNVRVEPGTIFVNPAGSFIVGGLAADTGVTNRKLMATAYGTSVQHGGGGLYGKDLKKVDRLGAYWARFICKNMVASGVCERLELGLYFIPGFDKPTYFIKDYTIKRTKFKNKVPNKEDLERVINEVFGKFTYAEIFSLFAPWSSAHLHGYADDCHFGNRQSEFMINPENVCMEKEIWESLNKSGTSSV